MAHAGIVPTVGGIKLQIVAYIANAQQTGRLKPEIVVAGIQAEMVVELRKHIGIGYEL